MTIESLQKIFTLEAKLLAAEQAEQERADLWLNDEEEKILRQHDKELAALEEKKEASKTQAAKEAKQKASAMVKKAKAQADKLDKLADAALAGRLTKALKFITGQLP